MATPGAGFTVLPQFQGNLYDIQTKQALAQALMQKGLTGSPELYRPAGGGFQYVPSMGIGGLLAQALQGYVGGQLQQQANQGLAQLGQQQWAALTGQGMPTQPSGPSTGQLATALQGGGGPTNANAANLSSAMQAPQAAAQPAPLAPGGAMNPGGAPVALAAQSFFADPKEYLTKAMEYYKPAAIVADLRAAGIDPNSAIGRQIVQGRLAKENYIAPTAFAGGGYVNNPMTGTMEQLPQVPEGFTAQRTPSGQWAIVPAAGGPGAVELSSRATAAGRAAVEPITGVQDGQPVFTNKLAAATGGGAAGGPQPSVGRFSGYQAPGGPVRPSLSPAEQEGQIGLAKGNVATYNTLKADAAGSADRANTMDALEAYARGRTDFGPGWTGRIENLAAINAKLPSGLAFGSNDVSNAQIVQKLASNLIQQYQKSMGGSGTDKQMELIMHGTPGADMTNKAMLEVIPKLKSMEVALQAKANAADSWLAANNNNPASLNKFETTWRNNYDPRIYQMSLMDPAQRAAFMAGQKDSAALKTKVKTALDNGWVQ